jgi:hypothetical protein
MLTIAWDRDDVLCELMREWFVQSYLPAHPSSTLRYEEITSNPPSESLGMSMEEYLASLDEFRASPAFDAMQPVAPMLDWFKRNGDLYRHVLVTSTTLVSAPAATAWTFRHFGRWIRSVHVLPAKRPGEDLPAYDTDKGSILARLDGVAVLVDDSICNIAAAEAVGVPGLLVPQPWNDATGTIADALTRLDDLLETNDSSSV